MATQARTILIKRLLVAKLLQTGAPVETGKE
jgi:hypothetical protein